MEHILGAPAHARSLPRRAPSRQLPPAPARSRLSQASFQKIRHPASQPSCADPLQRMFSRCTVFAILRPPIPSAGSQVLCARLPTFIRAPQYCSISGMNGSLVQPAVGIQRAREFLPSS